MRRSFTTRGVQIHTCPIRIGLKDVFESVSKTSERAPRGDDRSC
jgi:hypothetical protein